MRYDAYLVVICDRDTNAILDAVIWSSPEWEQSRQLSQPTYVAYAMGGKSFQDAMDQMISWMISPHCRYSYLLQYMDPLRLKGYLSRVDTWESFEKNFYSKTQSVEGK